MTDILTRLKTVWPAGWSLQPNTKDDFHCVIEIQQLKLDAVAEIERLRRAQFVMEKNMPCTEFYPYGVDKHTTIDIYRIFEALSQSPDSFQKAISAEWANAKTIYEKVQVFEDLDCEVKRYWQEMEESRNE